jgi:nicotinamide-nucleotide amidase
MDISDDARRLVERLADRNIRLVLAESCTGGMVSAELAKVPGVSQWYCGSAVTYRGDTKTSWLGVDSSAIEQHTAVSDVVARQMACGVLQRTPEAEIAASITGHFGPSAPAGFDGLVFIATARRDGQAIDIEVQSHRLNAADRPARQREATHRVLAALSSRIDSLV